jgi:hypothetical protein
MASLLASCDVYRCARLFYFHCFQTPNFYSHCEQGFFNNATIRGNLDLSGVVLWTCLHVSFNAYLSILFCYVSDFTGVNPSTNHRMILYYCLMTKWIGLGDSTVFSWAGCHTSSTLY